MGRTNWIQLWLTSTNVFNFLVKHIEYIFIFIFSCVSVLMYKNSLSARSPGEWEIKAADAEKRKRMSYCKVVFFSIFYSYILLVFVLLLLLINNPIINEIPTSPPWYCIGSTHTCTQTTTRNEGDAELYVNVRSIFLHTVWAAFHCTYIKVHYGCTFEFL